MTDQTSAFDLYKLYLATAEKVSDRRAAANQWLLGVNGAIVAFYGYLESAGAEAARIVIPIAGVLICFAWIGLLSSYRKLNSAKFAVLQEIEAGFDLQLFAAEEAHYNRLGRGSLAQLETYVPICFVMLYLLIIIVSLS